MVNLFLPMADIEGEVVVLDLHHGERDALPPRVEQGLVGRVLHLLVDDVHLVGQLLVVVRAGVALVAVPGAPEVHKIGPEDHGQGAQDHGDSAKDEDLKE